MQYKVTAIEFDFDNDLYPLTEAEMDDIYGYYIGTFWEADDGDDLVEEITSARLSLYLFDRIVGSGANVYGISGRSNNTECYT